MPTACNQSPESTQLLTKCNVNSQNHFGDTPLHLACENNKGNIVHYLVEEVKCDINIPNKKGEYALHIACRQSLSMARLLHRSDLNHQDVNGNTPLHNSLFQS